MLSQAWWNRLRVVQILAVFSLVAAQIVCQTVKYTTGHDAMFGLTGMFDLDDEWNLPAFWQSGNLLLAAALLGQVFILRRRSRQEARGWAVLAAVFVFLAADELLAIHESLVTPVRESLHTDGALRYAWVIPYGLGAAMLGLCQLRFLLKLPRWIGRGMMMAGTCYLAGAIGMEMVGSWWVSHWGLTPMNVLFITIEESLEMIGIALLNHVLLQIVAVATVDQWLDLGQPRKWAAKNSSVRPQASLAAASS